MYCLALFFSFAHLEVCGEWRSSGIGMWGYGVNRAGSGQGQLAGSSNSGNKPSRSIKCEEFLD
jgi:hypothetical protein